MPRRSCPSRRTCSFSTATGSSGRATVLSTVFRPSWISFGTQGSGEMDLFTAPPPPVANSHDIRHASVGQPCRNLRLEARATRRIVCLLLHLRWEMPPGACSRGAKWQSLSPVSSRPLLFPSLSPIFFPSRIFFVTNNSTKSRKGYKKKFDSLGLVRGPRNSLLVLVTWSRTRARDTPIGWGGLKSPWSLAPASRCLRYLDDASRPDPTALTGGNIRR